MPYSFKTRLKNLSITKKFILVGSLLAFIGVFLPWYKDIDQYKIGEMFLGITGPLYLAGVLILLSSVASFGIIALKLFEKPIPKLPLKENHFHVLSSGFSLFMLILSISVFFHHKFGINIVDKSISFGMYMTFVGAGLVMFGAILAIRKSDVDFEQEGNLEPLINIESKQDRPQQEIKPKKEEVVEETLKVNTSVQESIDDFTGEKNNTNDIH